MKSMVVICFSCGAEKPCFARYPVIDTTSYSMQMALRRGPNVSLNEETIFGNKKISKNALNVWSTKMVKMNAPSTPIILFTMS